MESDDDRLDVIVASGAILWLVLGGWGVGGMVLLGLGMGFDEDDGGRVGWCKAGWMDDDALGSGIEVVSVEGSSE